jgi:hypothetical protein
MIAASLINLINNMGTDCCSKPMNTQEERFVKPLDPSDRRATARRRQERRQRELERIYGPEARRSSIA